MRLLSRRRTAGRHLPVNRFLRPLRRTRRAPPSGLSYRARRPTARWGCRPSSPKAALPLPRIPSQPDILRMPESAFRRGAWILFFPRGDRPRACPVRRLLYARRTALPDAEPLLQGAAGSAKDHSDSADRHGGRLRLYKTERSSGVARRMILQKIDSLPRYEAYLEQNATGGGGVLTRTSSSTLRTSSASRRRSRRCSDKVLPKLIANRPHGEPLARVGPWMLYRRGGVLIAITLLEFLEKRAPATPIRGFRHGYQRASR